MGHVHKTIDNSMRKSGVALLSVISNSTLVALKLIVGMMTGSVSVISEAIHSTIDLLAAIIAFLSVRTSGKPADDEHPFGHSKYENISGAVEAILIFVAAAWIIKEAIHKFTEPQPLEMLGWGVGVMLISSILNVVVSRMLMKVGKETESVALKADAWHLLTDVYTSLGVMVALGIVWAGKFILPAVNMNWIDPVAAIMVALLIVKAAGDLTIESVRDLLDVRISPDEEIWIHDLLAGKRPVVHGFHGLRTRKAGAVRFIQFHLVMEPAMSLAKSHEISDEVESAILEKFPGAFVNIHIEPCDGHCKPVCKKGCLLPENERAERQRQVTLSEQAMPASHNH